MLIKSIFMEVRSRLRSCNVFITTAINLSQNCNLKICIQATCLVLNYFNEEDSDKEQNDSLTSIENLSDCSTDEDNEIICTIQIGEFCKVIPNSMSCLKIEKNSISFRILTEPINGGNFFKELLSTQSKENMIKSTGVTSINIKANNLVKIVCSNCSNDISENALQFQRVLELPSANINMSEWFCHGHGHGSGHSNIHGNSSQDTTDLNFKPNKNDFLYRMTYFVVNISNLSQKMNKFNSKRNVYHCDRCLAWLGLKEKDTVKLFNSEVKINHDGTEVQAITHSYSGGDIRIDDFIFTIEYLTKEFNLGLQYMIMCKIVLVCTMSATNKQFLLIWIMDRQLQVLRNTEDVICGDHIKLQSFLLTKILFKVEMSLNDEVKNWLADPTVVSTDISKNMFCSGLEHLQKISQKVPEAFRVTNGYQVSYLKI